MSQSRQVEELELQVLAEIQTAKHRFQLARPEDKPDALRDLRQAVQKFSRVVLDGVVPNAVWAATESDSPAAVTIPLGTTLREGMRILIDATLQHTNHNISAAARMLQINRATLWKRFNRQPEGSKVV
jgi:DNA-binding NtrC family response regulator